MVDILTSSTGLRLDKAVKERYTVIAFHTLVTLYQTQDSVKLKSQSALMDFQNLLQKVMKSGDKRSNMMALMGLSSVNPNAADRSRFGSLLSDLLMTPGGLSDLMDCIISTMDSDTLEVAQRNSFLKVLTAIPGGRVPQDYYNFIFSEAALVLSEEATSTESYSLRKALVSALVVKLVDMRPSLGRKSVLKMLEPLVRSKPTSNVVDFDSRPIVSTDHDLSRCLSAIANLLTFGDPSEEFALSLLNVFRSVFMIWQTEEALTDKISDQTFDIIRSILTLSPLDHSVSTIFDLVVGSSSNVIGCRSSTGAVHFVLVETPRYVQIAKLIALVEKLESQDIKREIFTKSFENYQEYLTKPRFLRFVQALLTSFDSVLYGSPLNAFAFAKTILLSGQKDEKTSALALSILYLLLSDSQAKDTLPQKDITELLILVQAFCNSDSDELRELAIALSQLSSNSIRSPNTIKSQSSDRFQVALNELKDPIIPIRAHGIKLLQNMIDEKDAFVEKAMEVVMEILVQILSDMDSFIYLNGVKCLASAVVSYPSQVLSRVLALYSDPTLSLDVRLRIGEALMQSIRKLGEAFAKYADTVCCSIFQLMEIDKDILPSCFSLLSYVSDVSPVSLGPSFTWLLQYVKDLFVFDASLPNRRAAANFLYSISVKVHDIKTLLPGGSVKELMRMLKQIYELDKDDACRHYAERGLQSLQIV
ncbi:armadillo-type protein [Chytridium lagenaria]|nr:armadillo-type protein [Chytridium lagenaria]